MIKLLDIDEDNLNQVLALRVRPEQARFVPSPEGILARAWSCRGNNAACYAIASEEGIVGLALVRDVPQEPACHYLMELMIDGRFQKRGYALAALGGIISIYRAEPRFPVMELSVDRANKEALRLFLKAGFKDGGYVDPALPQYINMTYPLA